MNTYIINEGGMRHKYCSDDIISAVTLFVYDALIVEYEHMRKMVDKSFMYMFQVMELGTFEWRRVIVTFDRSDRWKFYSCVV